MKDVVTRFTPPRKTMKITAKLCLAFAAIALIPLIVVGIAAYRAGSDALRQRVHEQLESVAVIQRNRLEAIVDQNLERVALVASRTQMRISLERYNREKLPADQAKMNTIIADALTSIESFETISLLDLDGHIVASTAADQIGDNVADATYFLRGRDAPQANTFLRDTDGSLKLVLSAPLYLDDERIGVIAVKSGVRNILALVADYSGLGDTGETILAKANDAGDAVFISPLRFDPNAALVRTVPKEALEAPITQALAGKQTFFSSAVDYRGQAVLAMTQYIPATDWGLVVKIDLGEALEPIHAFRNIFATAILITGVVVLLLSILVARSITRRVTLLTRVSERISDGDLSMRADVCGSDEIDVLASNFNTMTDRLIDANRNLEAKVAERTRELTSEIQTRKLVEGELRVAKAAAEASTEAKAAFLANMSHEIRTPMNGIVGMTGLLSATKLTTDQSEFVGTIRTSCESLLTIINDILDFSKIESGELTLECHPFSLRECVEDVLDLLALDAEEKGVELAYITEDKIPEVVSGDSTRLRQILLNLINNAVKFTHEGEVVLTIHHNLIEGDLVSINFAVRDSGIGIPADKLDALFKAFTQADSSTTRLFGGTGLGLVISKMLCEMMGGTISVESEVGKGTVFSFNVIVNKSAEQRFGYLHSSHPELSKRVLLAVDDNPVNRRIIRLHGESWGMIVRETEYPAQALSWVQAGEQFNVGIIDFQMPGMDGRQLAYEIRQTRRPDQLPLILLSSMGSLADSENADSALFQAVMNKPIKPSSIYHTLCEVLLGKAFVVQQRSRFTEIDSKTAETYPLRILVADDNRVNQTVAIRTLSGLGYQADVAANGIEVLKALERQDYDLILMDVQMPEMDGIEATRRIVAGANASGAAPPHIFAMTAAVSPEDESRCRAAGMIGFLAKPFRISDVYQVIHAVYASLHGEGAPECDSDDGAVSGSVPTNGDVEQAIMRRISETCGITDRSIISELFGIYVVEAVEIQTQLAAAIDGNAFGDIATLAHKLKGISANVGLAAVVQEATKLESIGDGEDRSSVAARVRVLLDCTDESIAILRELINTPATESARTPVLPVK